MENLTVAIGCDHGGYDLKTKIVEFLTEKGVTLIDVGTNSCETVDHPIYAKFVCDKVSSGEAKFGILICGSGIGISIAANRFSGIRCAVCHDYYTGMMSREHNDANVLALGGRVIGEEVARQIVEVFLSTRFLSEHQNHPRRVQMLNSFA